ncbi:hypothetical protein Aasi_1285 [Candidatus Amoebophilus asiaticus 5a2]|uniref:Protein kinase domain-containing protein n=1 Tax=Amoebophilus asiaticus (strain 5a2) TaxID=452471 RepID=B3ETP8_AMOA5|nr:hypothetical protein [Candidatus Amoebophilus asiaticus]ACE06600.1 hypothetical protein Aasi_1285 [Candidatus Amoebophilus asiaticus 5a2]
MKKLQTQHILLYLPLIMLLSSCNLVANKLGMKKGESTSYTDASLNYYESTVQKEIEIAKLFHKDHPVMKMLNELDIDTDTNSGNVLFAQDETKKIIDFKPAAVHPVIIPKGTWMKDFGDYRYSKAYADLKSKYKVFLVPHPIHGEEGIVFKAQRISDNQLVAIKFIQEGYQEHIAWQKLSNAFNQERYATLKEYFPEYYEYIELMINDKNYVLIITEWIDSK